MKAPSTMLSSGSGFSSLQVTLRKMIHLHGVEAVPADADDLRELTQRAHKDAQARTMAMIWRSSTSSSP